MTKLLNWHERQQVYLSSHLDALESSTPHSEYERVVRPHAIQWTKERLVSHLNSVLSVPVCVDYLLEWCIRS